MSEKSKIPTQRDLLFSVRDNLLKPMAQEIIGTQNKQIITQKKLLYVILIVSIINLITTLILALFLLL